MASPLNRIVAKYAARKRETWDPAVFFTAPDFEAAMKKLTGVLDRETGVEWDRIRDSAPNVYTSLGDKIYSASQNWFSRSVSAHASLTLGFNEGQGKYTGYFSALKGSEPLQNISVTVKSFSELERWVSNFKPSDELKGLV